MLTFEQWSALVSPELAGMLLEELASTRIIDEPSAGSANTKIISKRADTATRVLSTGEKNAINAAVSTDLLDNPREASRMTSKYVHQGYNHLMRAQQHVEKGMLSIGSIIDLARKGLQKQISDEQFAKALEVIRLSLDTQNAKDHPVSRLVRIKQEIEDLIERLNTTQRQSISYSGVGIA